MIEQTHSPSYIPLVLKCRIVLLLLLPNAWRIDPIIRGMNLCRGERTMDGWMDIKANKITVGEWSILVSHLPPPSDANKIMGSKGTHREFSDALFGANTKRGYKKITNRDPSRLIEQMWTFSLPTPLWEKMWALMDFSRNPALLERLYWLKEKRGWEPNV